MNKGGLFIFILWASILWGRAEWSNEQVITLKRNEVQKMTLLVGINDARELRFHWTLFVDGGLVFLAKYDHFNHQTILRDGYKKNAMRINLSQTIEGEKPSPYLVVFFQEYDKKNQTATFKVVTYGDVFVQ